MDAPATKGENASGKRFRIAFSFAGEKRNFVSQVAAILAKRFGQDAILYDNYHKAEFGRARLGRYLPKLYHEQSDLIVVVICNDYAKKEWCGLEWDAIFDLLKKRREDEVALCNFDRATVEGLYSDSGFMSFDDETPEQAADLILQRLALNEDLPRDHYLKPAASPPPTPGAAIPNNLPRLGPFFGREKELAQIANALAPTARGWGALIDGPGGIGKTSLAIRAAELVSADRFKRIIYLSAKKRELTADGERALSAFVVPGYLEMLNALARELNRPELSKSTEEDRTHVLLGALKDENALLVLDNLETLPSDDRDRLFAFLNNLPAGCSALVTSRRRADATAVAVRLDRLEWPAAQALIHDLNTGNEALERATEDERKALYEETGGNPLLMRWLAGQMRLGRRPTVTAALEFLRAAPPGNDPLEYVFGDLLETFSGNETKVLAALAHFSDFVETRFIAELAGINAAAAEGALGDLAIRALVQPDVEYRSFTLVAMVADFLRRKRSEAVAETGDRLENNAYAIIVQNGYEHYERFPVLDAAWPTISPALPRFIAGPNDRLQTVCNALRQFLSFSGRLDERFALSERAEAKAVAAGDNNNAGRRAFDSSWVASIRGQAEAVLVGAERAAVHWEAAKGGVSERALAIRLRGIGHLLKKEYPDALATFKQAFELLRGRSVQSNAIAVLLEDIAGAERKIGDFGAAERDYAEALCIARTNHYSEGVAAFTGGLAELRLDQEMWSEAETLAREALALTEDVGRLELIGGNCRRIATALLRQGKGYDEARRLARRAVEIFTGLGSHHLEGARAILLECEATTDVDEPDES